MEMMEDERFTNSDCKCDFCVDTHKSIRDWTTYEAQTHLQTRMKDIVRRIERRIEIEKSINEKRKN